MKSKPPKSARVCFIGTNSLFSFTAFKTLFESDVNITQVILSGYAPAPPLKVSLPVLPDKEPDNRANTLQQLADQQHTPITYLGSYNNRQQEWQNICGHTESNMVPDYIFVACFPEKLPSILLNWPHQESINLHPSLLPKYRGPDPIFWQLHNFEIHTGISLHILNDELDAGPLLHQHEITFPTGATRSELDILLAQQGAQAFVQLLVNDEFVTTAQDETQASYQPWPDKNNYADDSEMVEKSL